MSERRAPGGWALVFAGPETSTADLKDWIQYGQFPLRVRLFSCALRPIWPSLTDSHGCGQKRGEVLYGHIGRQHRGRSYRAT
jgi:hypothetical protein